MSSVAARAVDWLWRGRVPFGMVTVLDGDSGVGKSSVAADLAARLTRGRPMPLSHDPPTAPSGVLVLSAEESPAHTVRPRLDAAGADLDLCHILADDAAVSLPGGVPAIEATVRLHGIRLVVVDPVMSYLAPGVDSNSDQSVRQALGPLVGMAERTGCAVLLIRHTNKKEGQAAGHRGGGSVAFRAVARSHLIAGRDPADRAVRALASDKCSVGREPETVDYAVGGSEGAPRVEWGSLRPDLTADAIVTRPECRPGGGPSDRERVTKAAEAAAFLARELNDGPLPSRELAARAAAAGISERTLIRARQELCEPGAKSGMGGGWTVRLRADSPAPVADGTAGVGEDLAEWQPSGETPSIPEGSQVDAGEGSQRPGGWLPSGEPSQTPEGSQTTLSPRTRVRDEERDNPTKPPDGVAVPGAEEADKAKEVAPTGSGFSALPGPASGAAPARRRLTLSDKADGGAA